MTFAMWLNVATIVMCALTLTVCTAALLPQIKRGLALMRDGTLWMILIGTLLLSAVVGWGRFFEAWHQTSGSSKSAAPPPRNDARTKVRAPVAAMTNVSAPAPRPSAVSNASTPTKTSPPATAKQSRTVPTAVQTRKPITSFRPNRSRRVVHQRSSWQP